jgi:endonuclease YncB( thermonuclease family)
MARFLHSVLAVGLFCSLLAARWTPPEHVRPAPVAQTAAARPGLTIFNALGIAVITGRYEIEGPVTAEVLRVIDGDTITVRAHIWIGQELTTNVRLSGVNAPELSGHCEEERSMAEAAGQFLAERVEGRSVTLRNIGLDKYGGRVVARVEDNAGDIATALLAARLVVPYDGGRRGSWCE